MKKDFVMPVLVLSLICLFISGALAVTNSFTQPVIEAAAAARADAARKESIPQATGFEPITITGLPDTINEVYSTTNNVGYVFVMSTTGYGGDIKLICGIDPDGRIIRCVTLAQTETKGLGSLIAEPAYTEQYIGKDESLDGVSAVSGATISSNAYLDAVKDALAAFEMVKGAD